MYEHLDSFIDSVIGIGSGRRADHSRLASDLACTLPALSGCVKISEWTMSYGLLSKGRHHEPRN